MKNVPHKSIIFVLDSFELTNWEEYQKRLNIEYSFAKSYKETEKLINERADYIVTYSLAHIAFDLIDLGYDIYVFNKESQKKFFPGMYSISTDKDIRFGHNIFKLLHAHVFDDDLNCNDCKEYIDYVL